MRAAVGSAAHGKFTGNLVDVTTGMISREIFVSDEIYKRELEQVFARAWLFIGHESQIPNPGDFFSSRMGEESVLLTRDRQGQIHVFLNTCRHRGMKVCRYDQGNTTIFTCPYHGWGYATDGKLVGVPYFREAYHEKLDRPKWGLVEVAQMENYKGSIWASWDPDAPAFSDYLGGMRVYLDLLLDSRDGREGDAEVLGGIQKWIVPCNWKFAAENFVGDAYHAISHRSVDTVGIAPGGKGRTDDGTTRPKRYAVSFPDLGHGTNTTIQMLENEPYTPIYPNVSELQDYLKREYEERQQRLGNMSRLLGSASTIFPNTSFQPRQPRTLAVWHPHGPTKTEMWRFVFVDREAPEKLKDLVRRYHELSVGPVGMTEQDDMENWVYATSASAGTIARRYPYNYEMGLGGGQPSDFPPGLISDVPSEKNQRGFYGRWAEFMDASGWSDLYPKRVGR